MTPSPVTLVVVKGQFGQLEPRKLSNPPGFLSEPVTPIEQEFVAFHRNNPAIYAEIEAVARKLWQQSPSHISMRFLWEWVRYELQRKNRGAESIVRFRNALAPLYGQLLLAQHPEWHGVIRLRHRNKA